MQLFSIHVHDVNLKKTHDLIQSKKNQVVALPAGHVTLGGLHTFLLLLNSYKRREVH